MLLLIDKLKWSKYHTAYHEHMVMVNSYFIFSVGFPEVREDLSSIFYFYFMYNNGLGGLLVGWVLCRDRVSLCNYSGCFRTCSVVLPGLELPRDPPASVSWYCTCVPPTSLVVHWCLCDGIRSPGNEVTHGSCHVCAGNLTRSRGRAASVLNHWAISPVLK